MRKVLITGASGFVGQSVCPALGVMHEVRCALRSAGGAFGYPGGGSESCIVGEIGPDTQWDKALQGIEGVIHLAAKVHVVQKPTTAIRNEYQRVNVQGSETLARAAARAGVRRFVYLSSIKVNGDATTGSNGFIETDGPNPQDLYGQSKWDAEKVLAAVSRETGMEVVIIRPPLVYGPGVKANFLSLLHATYRGWPLPLGGIDNRRSFIFVDNLVHALIKCLQHPNASGRTFLVADVTISVADLVRKLSLAFGRRPRLLPVPVSLLKGMGVLLGKSPAIERLTSSLAVDDREIRRALDWIPPVTMDDGLMATCSWYKSAFRSAS